jgi:hypothetical protein
MGCRAILAGVAVVIAMAVAGGPAQAQEPVGPAVFFKVVFKGSGHYVVNGAAECNASQSCWNGPIHQDLALNSWTATYPAVQLGTSGASGSAAAGDQQFDASFEGTDTNCDDASTGDCHNEDCFATYASDPGAAPITLDGTAAGGSLNLRVEAPWHLIGTSLTCLPIHMPDPVLPDAWRAVTSIPLSAFDKGTVTKAVSSGDPGAYQMPSDCTAEAQGDNSEVTNCIRTSNWSGSLTITPDCVSGTATGAPWCIKKKQKDDWAQSAKDWRSRQENLDNVATASECLKAGTANADPENKWNCAVQNVARGTAKSMAQADQQLADDPPDLNYDAVMQPSAVSIRKLGPLKKHARRFVALETRYRQAAALMRALLVSQNRATGAFLATAQGTDASAALAKQNAAVLLYARRAAKLLNGQSALAKHAAAELRPHGKRGRKLAGLLVTALARKADTRTAAGLAAFGH